MESCNNCRTTWGVLNFDDNDRKDSMSTSRYCTNYWNVQRKSQIIEWMSQSKIIKHLLMWNYFISSAVFLFYFIFKYEGKE